MRIQTGGTKSAPIGHALRRMPRKNNQRHRRRLRRRLRSPRLRSLRLPTERSPILTCELTLRLQHRGTILPLVRSMLPTFTFHLLARRPPDYPRNGTEFGNILFVAPRPRQSKHHLSADEVSLTTRNLRKTHVRLEYRELFLIASHTPVGTAIRETTAAAVPTPTMPRLAHVARRDVSTGQRNHLLFLSGVSIPAAPKTRHVWSELRWLRRRFRRPILTHLGVPKVAVAFQCMRTANDKAPCLRSRRKLATSSTQ